MRKLSLLAMVLLAVIFSSCFKELADKIDDVEDVQWNPSLALPLTNGSFAIDEFADEFSGENFSVGYRDDDLIVFRYSKGDFFTQTAEDLVQVEDQSFNTTFGMSSADIPQLPIDLTITQSEDHNFTLVSSVGDKIYSTIGKAGTMDIVLEGDFPTSGEIELVFNSVTKDGETITTRFPWVYSGSNVQRFEQSIDLTDVHMDFTDGGTTYNFFNLTTNLTLHYEGQAITAANQFDLTVNLRDIEFAQIIGNFNTRSIAQKTYEFTVSFVDQLSEGGYYFDEPTVNINFANSFGAPFSTVINQFEAIAENRGSIALTGDAINNPFLVDYPQIEEMGQTMHSTFTIDYQNSNLPEVFAWQPDTMYFDFEGIANELGDDGQHFVLDTSRLEVGVDFEFPMIGRFRNLTLSELYDFDGSIFEDIDNALLRLSSENGFPIDANVQLYFLDEQGGFLDSLIYDDQDLLVAGITDINGKVTEPTSKEVDVLINKERLGPISLANRILTRITLNTPDNDTRSVRIYRDDRLSLKLFAQTQLDITF